MMIPGHKHLASITFYCKTCDRSRHFIEDIDNNGQLRTQPLVVIPEFCRICLNTMEIELPKCCEKALEIENEHKISADVKS